MVRQHLLFVTGKLAEHALRTTLADLAPRAGFDYTVAVEKITVAALMTTEWLARRLKVPPSVTRVILPGYCGGDLQTVVDVAGVPVERGPKDLRDLPEYFGRKSRRADYGRYDIEILAEINHAPRLSRDELLAEAARLAADGADVIDVGCEPGEPWRGVGEAVRSLRDAGHRVSIDSMNPVEIEPAVRAGAELVLSVDGSNRLAAADWGCEVIAIPDRPGSLTGLDETIEHLAKHSIPFRVDPILEPIGHGFAASLQRYSEVRRRFPAVEMMMGIGNLSELTDVDSAGVNVLLLGICQELGIRSVLTTQVINWARTAVRECDLARRLVHYAVTQHSLPKHVEPRLVMLRDPKLHEHGCEALERMAAEIRDPNYRLFAEGGCLHLVGAGLHLQSTDPFELFDALLAQHPTNVDATHAFYLGYELAKATAALTLGKDYHQDQPLDWGFLTVPEQSRHARLAARREAMADGSACDDDQTTGDDDVEGAG